MNEFIKAINKYIILLMFNFLFGMPWLLIRVWILGGFSPESIVNSIPILVDYLIRIIVIILFIIDFKKYNLKNVVISCIGALFSPTLGIVIFAIMFLENERNKANA